MNHVHISGFVIFCVVVLILGLTLIVSCSRAAKRRDMLRAAAIAASPVLDAQPSYSNWPYAAAVPYQRPMASQTTNAPQMQTGQRTFPPQMQTGQQTLSPQYSSGLGHSDGLLTGLLIGDMIGNSGHHDTTTVVHDNYAPASASHDSGTFDSGASSSYDSGGVDFSSSGGGDGGSSVSIGC